LKAFVVLQIVLSHRSNKTLEELKGLCGPCPVAKVVRSNKTLEELKAVFPVSSTLINVLFQ